MTLWLAALMVTGGLFVALVAVQVVARWTGRLLSAGSRVSTSTGAATSAGVSASTGVPTSAGVPASARLPLQAGEPVGSSV